MKGGVEKQVLVRALQNIKIIQTGSLAVYPTPGRQQNTSDKKTSMGFPPLFFQDNNFGQILHWLRGEIPKHQRCPLCCALPTPAASELSSPGADLCMEFWNGVTAMGMRWFGHPKDIQNSQLAWRTWGGQREVSSPWTEPLKGKIKGKTISNYQ